MSYKLKNRRNSIPNGFLYRQALTGWENDKVCPPSVWDFYLLCSELQKHRISNPRFKLNTDLTAIQNEVDAKNAERIAALPNSESYVISDAAPPSFYQAPVRAASQAFVAAARAIRTGAETITDFMDSGESPVAQELAESRAAVCACMTKDPDGTTHPCPLNGKGDLSRWFTIPAAERIRKQLEIKEKRNLRTSQDALLGVCEACLCVNRLKVWFPLALIVKHMTEDVKAQLHPSCWVLAENKESK